MVGRAWDLSACATCAAAAIAVALFGTVSATPTALRASIALPLVLVLAGWSVAAALRPVPGLPFEEHFTFALGLGVAIAVLGGLVLNVTPWGLDPQSWAVFEGGVTLLCCAIAWQRGYGRRPPALRRSAPLGVGQLVLLLAALALAVAAMVVARAGALDRHNSGFTQFAIDPASSGDQHIARLRVENDQNRRETYIARVVQGSTALQEWTAITLAPGQSWQAMVDAPTAGLQSGPIDAYLFRSEDLGSVYRTVSLWPGAGR